MATVSAVQGAFPPNFQTLKAHDSVSWRSYCWTAYHGKVARYNIGGGGSSRSGVVRHLSTYLSTYSLLLGGVVVQYTFKNPSAFTAVFVPSMQVILPCKNRENAVTTEGIKNLRAHIGQIPPHSPGADLHTFTFVCLRWLFTDSTMVKGICLICLQPPQASHSKYLRFGLDF